MANKGFLVIAGDSSEQNTCIAFVEPTKEAAIKKANELMGTIVEKTVRVGNAMVINEETADVVFISHE